jgi:ribosome-associated protein
LPIEPKNLALQVCSILKEKKALDVEILDVHNLTTLTDYFVVASGSSESQVNAIYEELEHKLSEKGITALHKDGAGSSRWIVLDYGCVIVHIFHKKEREFYNFERLWADAELIAIDNI